jgi:hypothetical protein
MPVQGEVQAGIILSGLPGEPISLIQFITMSNTTGEKDEKYKNPNEDSMVTSNHLAGKKVDADLENENEKPSEEGNLVTEASQKGKKVDADLDNENERPSNE